MNENKDPNGHDPERPEYVILDGDYKEEQKSHQSWDEMSNLSKMKVPSLIRVIAFCLAFLCVMWLGGGIIGWSLVAVADLVTFHKFPVLGFLTERFWLGIKRAMALGCGFLVSTFSPPLGAGFIMLYCLLLEDKNNAFAESMKSNFTKYSS